jgi:hypothetical protein
MAREPNPALAVPFQGWLHPELAEHHHGLTSLAGYLESTLGAVPKIEDLKPHEQVALEWFENLPRYANGLALSAPIIHPDLCELLIEEIKHPANDWRPNENEGKAYQIPEIVLRREIPTLHRSLNQFAEQSLFKIMFLLWGKVPKHVESIQLAWYSADGTRSTEWHHDTDSNMTAVINLAPELFAGGGTDIRTGIRTYDHIPPVPKGHALLFNGHQSLHRGAPVEVGDRYILVYWTNDWEG